jgi:hypothetical protein
MSGAPEQFLSIQVFLFEAPLYAEYSLESDVAFKMFVSELVVDGYCVRCGRASTFDRRTGGLKLDQLEELLQRHPCWFFGLNCTRDKSHEIIFALRLEAPLIQKIGQYPSLADIANDESRSYRKVLMPADAAELHRAIGLAAHGVGVGSFVYLRRVFERLITSRFDTFKTIEGWAQEDFVGKRMEDKIELLEHNLPDFLVRNKRIYAILSKGIHELEEKECINAFEMLKHAIFFILDEDRHKKEESERRLAAEKAIAAFKG